MNSRVSWSVEGIDPSVRERAEAAARRAGMSLNDWLNSTIGDSAPPNFRSPPEQRFMAPSQESRDVADIHQRLDSITRQIEQISQPRPRSDMPRSDTLRNDMPRGDAPRNDAAPRSEQGVAKQLNDAISRLDARLSQISNPQPPRQAPQDKQRQAEMVERAAAQVYRPSPPLSPASFDFAIAEIAARQNELDAPAPRQMPPRSAPPIAPVMAPVMAPPMAPPPIVPPAPPSPDFSSLERHLLKITSQIEALQRPDGIEQSIAAFRSELTEIRQALTEAMPRRAIESIENEIRSLSRRIDETRQNGIDANALSGIERALSEIREVLRSLMPAEQLAGYDEAIRNLGTKLDLILRSNDDPSTVQQLEGAIAALRAIVSNVASNDALARLSDDVHTLSSKVDQLSRAGDNRDSFAILEQRIAALTSTLESRERPAPAENTDQIEGALRALSDRIDRLPVGTDNASAFAHLEQRVSYLLERLEALADQRPSVDLGRVEDGLHDILRHLENQNTTFSALAQSSRDAAAAAAEPADKGLIDLVKRELSDIRFSQTEAGRHTQDSLEAVHNTLGHVVDRLAMIEGDLRAVRTQPTAPPPEAAAAAGNRRSGRAAAAAQTRIAQPRRGTGTLQPPRPANSRPRRRRYRPWPWRRRARSARSSSRIRRRAPRSSRACRPIIRSNRALGRPAAPRRRRSASQLPKAPSARFRPPPRRAAKRSAPRASSPPPAAPRRPPRPRNPLTARPAAARSGPPPATRPRRHRRSPPRSARFWSLRAWS